MVNMKGCRVLIFIGLISHKILVWGATHTHTHHSSKIKSGLFENGVSAQDVIVTFGTNAEMKELAHQVQSEYEYATKEDRIYALYEAFHGYHSECTSEASSYLDSNSYTYQGMWSTNTMVIRSADSACVHKLAAMKDVQSIGPNEILPLIDPIENEEEIQKQGEAFESDVSSVSILDDENTPPRPFKLGFSWGLTHIYVKEAWEYGTQGQYYGSYGELKNGKGIVVANIDTGVRADHEALKDNHRTYAGWADGYNLSSTEVDENGHGTHTMGTICGSHGIGVAPGAQWIACRGCLNSGCDIDALLFCCNWVLCPFDQSKGEPDNYKNCYTAPDVVSNSWGGGQGGKTFERCAIALRAAGMIPVWANGNSGPECTTANSPGDLPMVIAVGATDRDNKLADFSSRGPTIDGRIKPDISAPGVQVTSAWPTSPTSYLTISGTSMATPHVAGLIALMLQRCKLNYDMILKILQQTATREDLGMSEQICGGTTPDKFPNNFYGFGVIHALEAIKEVVKTCSVNSYGYGSNPVKNYVSIAAGNYGSAIGNYGGSAVGSYASVYGNPYQNTPSYPSYGRSGGDKFQKQRPYSPYYYYYPRIPYNPYGYFLYPQGRFY